MSADLLQMPAAEATPKPEAPRQAAPAPAAQAAAPSSIPEKFRDPATGELRLDALLKSYAELEKRLSQRQAPPAKGAPPEELQRFRQAMGIPETPDAYAITPAHQLCCADPEVNAKLHAAHFTNDQAQLVYDLAAERLLPLIAEAAAQFEADAQRQKLVAHYGGEDRFRRMAGQLTSWGKAKLPPAVFQALSGTAEGVKALELMMQNEAREPAVGRQAAPAGAPTEAELRSMMRDPRYWQSRDPQFVQRVTDGFRRLVEGRDTP